MARFILLTATGQDRPGIVANLSRILFENGCNIEDATMTRLRGEFTMMLIVKIPKGVTVDDIHRSLGKAGAALGLSLLIKTLSAKESSRVKPSRMKPFMLSVYGADKPGIVYRVTELIASHAVNITDMNTRVIGSEKKPIYVMVLEVEIPAKTKIRTLKAQLVKLKKQLAVDLAFHPAEPAKL